MIRRIALALSLGLTVLLLQAVAAQAAAPTNLVVGQSSRIVTASWTLPAGEITGVLEFSPTSTIDPTTGYFADANSFGYAYDTAETTFDSSPQQFVAGTYYVHVSAYDPTTCDPTTAPCEEFSSVNTLVVPPDPTPTPTPTPAPTPAPVPTPAAAPADTVTSFSALKVATSQRIGNLVVQASMGEPGTITVGGTVSVPKLSKVYKFKTASARATAGVIVKLRLKLPKKALAAVKKALKRHKKLKAKIRVTATDNSGNKASQNRAIKLKL